MRPRISPNVSLSALVAGGLIFAAEVARAFVGSVTADGEAAAVQSGFYECKRQATRAERAAGTNFNRVSEETLLVLVNEHVTQTQCACLLLFDGHEALQAVALTELSPKDNDEINLCRLLPAAVLTPSFAGVIEVVTADVVFSGGCTSAFDPSLGIALSGGSYGWVKNVTYKGKKTGPLAVDPFTANVVGVGKTELRVTPSAVDDGSHWAEQMICLGGVAVPPEAYLENTGE